ncbi:MAG: hypothetical protein ACXIVQ_11520 [Acidimicrobiales bacterium]
MEERRRPNPVVIIAGVWVLILAALAVVLVMNDGDAVDTSASEATGPALPAECENLHAGHDHMMWNPVMADEMTEADCPWPYEPFVVAADGGQVDESIAAHFEPVLYSELWDMFGRSDLGVCQVALLPDEPDDGLVFGFTYTVSQPGCAEDAERVDVVVREFVARGWRDHHAGEASSQRVLVFGRWVIEIDGSSPIADTIVGGLGDLGAVTV